jgi:TPP-dependent pyruvate/acetoin dehydrogenase alpha subunit
VTFEERLRDARDEDTIFMPKEGSEAATVAITEAVDTEADSFFPSS